MTCQSEGMSLLKMLCVCALAWQSAARAERFVAEVTRTESPNEALFAIHEKTGEGRKLVWSRKATWLASVLGNSRVFCNVEARLSADAKQGFFADKTMRS